MNTARANIINALHALENGKPAAEIIAWLKDAIDELNGDVTLTNLRAVLNTLSVS